MRTRIALFAGLLVLGLATFALRARNRAQAQEPPPAPRPMPPVGGAPVALPSPALPVPATPASPAKPGTFDIQKLAPLHRQMYLSAQRGGLWLSRMNEVKGRFVHGWLPALNAPMEGQHALRQAGAALALASSARYFHDEDQTARATQTILSLMQDTETDPANPQLRHGSMPSTVINRLSAAALLVVAIHELTAPTRELLDQGEQLCNYLRSQQRADGSFALFEKATAGAVDPDAENQYAGQALYALVHSHRLRPQPWKLDCLRKAFPAARKQWETKKSRDFVCWQSAAWTEAFLLTKEKTYAAFVLEMNDWLCELQYKQIDPLHPRWFGGFMDKVNDKIVDPVPTAHGAVCAESLAQACRVTRELGDLQRHEHYTATLERGLQFLCTLQYLPADTMHFTDWYRARLVGGFHGSHSDGNLRIDYTQHALCALVQYLTHVVRCCP